MYMPTVLNFFNFRIEIFVGLWPKKKNRSNLTSSARIDKIRVESSVFY